MSCEHKEWMQPQFSSDTPWRCSGCGMTMPAYAMMLWNMLTQIQARLADKPSDIQRTP